jgi:hypothetical protein
MTCLELKCLNWDRRPTVQQLLKLLVSIAIHSTHGKQLGSSRKLAAKPTRMLQQAVLPASCQPASALCPSATLTEWHSMVMGAPSTSRLSSSIAADTRCRYQSTAGRGFSVPFHQLMSASAAALRDQSGRPICAGAGDGTVSAMLCHYRGCSCCCWFAAGTVGNSARCHCCHCCLTCTTLVARPLLCRCSDSPA